MFTKLWEQAGMSYAQIIEELVELAMSRHRKSQMRASYGQSIGTMANVTAAENHELPG